MSRRCAAGMVLLLTSCTDGAHPAPASPATNEVTALVTATHAWVQGEAPPQADTPVFLQLYSEQGARLVGVNTPLAADAQIHEMAESGMVTKMREDGSVDAPQSALNTARSYTLNGVVVPMHELGGMDLPAGRVVDLKPAGDHVMLIGLKQALKAGDEVPLTLLLEDMSGQPSSITLRLPVKAK